MNLLPGHTFRRMLLIYFLLPWSALDHAADWPQFRGNAQRTGYYSDRVGYPAKKPLWVDSLRCEFVSSPSISGQTLYIGGRDSCIYAIDALNGKVRWKKRTGGWVDASPLIHQGMLIEGSRDGRMYILDTRNGGELASYTAGLQLSSAAMTPDGTILTGFGPPMNGFSAYLLSARMPVRSWFIPFNQITYSSPALSGSHAVIGVSDGRLYGINIALKDTVWRLNTGGEGYLSTPAIDDNAVFFAPGSFDRNIYAINLRDGQVLWKNSGKPSAAMAKSSSGVVISPAQFRELLRYSPEDRQQIIHALRNRGIDVPAIAAGQSKPGLLKKAEDSELFFAYGETKTSSVAVGENNVFVVQKELGYPAPRFTLLALDKYTGEESWKFSEIRSCIKLGYSSSPVVTGSMVFFGWGEGRVYALSVKTGEKMWADSLKGDVISSPAIANAKLYVATMAGYLYCYSLDNTMPGTDFKQSTYCYPNPARGDASNIQVYVSRKASMRLIVYNTAERPVLSVSADLPAMQPDEKYTYRWNIRNIANGVYFARIVVRYNDGGTDKKVLKIAVLK